MLSADYIPAALCFAPEYPLAANSTQELPLIEPGLTKPKYLDALAEVSAFQFFENVPGIYKTTIPVPANRSFEVWKLLSDRILLPEDWEFLKQDSARVRAIAEKLVWLGSAWLDSEILDQKQPLAAWEDALRLIEQYSYTFDFLDIDYYPAEIACTTRDELDEPSDWGIYPPHWQIHPTKTRAFNGGYIVDDYSALYRFRIEVWAGVPLFRNTRGRRTTLEDKYRSLRG